MGTSGASYGASGLTPKANGTFVKAGGAMVNGMEMEERKEPDFLRFQPGEVVEGILIGIDRVAIGDPEKPNAPKKPAVRFTVDTGEGARVSFLGTYDLVSKLHTEDKGHYVIVRYEGEDSSIAKNGNAMKRFRVSVSKGPVRTGAALDSLGITDDDIGF